MSERQRIGSILIDMLLGTADFERSIATIQKRFRSFGRDLERVGKDMSLNISAPITALGALALKSSISFESAFAGVRKTVNGTTEEMAGLRQQILDVSQKIPVSVEQLSKFAQIGGQMNLPVSSLAEFAETMGRMSASFDDVDTSKAATEMAKFAVQMKLPMDQFDNLGSSIAQLADQTAASEGPIIEIMNRLAGAGSSANMTASQIVGVAGAIDSLGIGVEMGATAFSRVILKMQAAAETGKGLEEWAGALNMTGEAFKKSFSENSAETLATFIDRLQNIKKEGGSVIGTLEGLGLKGALVQQTMLRTAGAGDAFRTSMVIANDAFIANQKLLTESTLRFGTLESKIKLAWNTFKVFLITVGDDFSPIVGTAVGYLIELSQWFQKLDPDTRHMGEAFLATAAAVGPTLVAIGGLITFLGGPYTVGVLAATALIGGLAAAYVTHGDQFKDGWNRLLNDFPGVIEQWKRGWEKVKEITASLVAETLEILVRWQTELENWASNKLDESFVQPFKRGCQKIKDAFLDLADYVVFNSVVPDMIKEIGVWAKKLEGEAMVDPTTQALSTTMDLWKEATEFIGVKVDKIDKLMNKLDSKGGKEHGGFFDGLFGGLAPKGQVFADDLGKQVGDSLVHAIEGALKSGDIKNAIKELGGELGKELGTAVFGPLGGVVGEYLGDKIAKDISQIGNSTKDTIKGIATAIDTIFPGIGTLAGMGANSIIGGSKDKDTTQRDAVQSYIQGQIGQNLNFGSGDQFEPGWADKWWKDMEANSVAAFTSLGVGLADILGVTEDVGTQIGYILSTNLGGNIDEARILMGDLGISAKQLEDAIIKQGLAAGKSWHEIEVNLQGIQDLTGTGLHGFADIEGAMGRLIISGGRGMDAIAGLKNIAIEAMEGGAKTLQDLEVQLRASGKFTEAEITALMQSLSNRGITSLQMLADGSVRTLGGVAADMETYLGEGFGQTEESVKNLIETIDSIPDNVEIRIHLTGDKIPDEITSGNSANVQRRGAPITSYARGGIFPAATYFSGVAGGELIGDRQKEGKLPLEMVNGKLGVNATGMGGVISQDVHIHLNMPNASPGAPEQVRQVMEQIIDRATAKTLRVLYESNRR